MQRTTKTLFAAALVALAAALLFFYEAYNQLGGLSLTFCRLLLALGLGQIASLKKFSYTLVILAAVTVSLTYPQYFTHIGNFQLKGLIVPLLQIITFGVGCTMSWHDLSGVLKMPKAVLVGVGCHYTIMPLVGFSLARIFGFPPEIAAGVVLVGCMPSGLASGIAVQMGKIATVGLAPAVNGPVMNTTFSLIATWWGSKPVEERDNEQKVPALQIDRLQGDKESAVVYKKN